jgi:hypothetical protein
MHNQSWVLRTDELDGDSINNRSPLGGLMFGAFLKFEV